MLDRNSDYGLVNHKDLKVLIHCFSDYFKQLFSSEPNEENGIHDSLFDYDERIDHKTLNELSSNLSSGFPIPSHMSIIDDKYLETPILLQEVIAVAWLNKYDTLQIKIFNEFLDTDYIDTIKELFRATDKNILRSIQVSEWVTLFHNKEPFELNEYLKEQSTKKSQQNNLLVDHEIVQEIVHNKHFNVVPIINIDNQLNTVSFDIRLGSSFEVFFLNKYGESENKQRSELYENIESKTVDLDFKESFQLSRGQFILGHSMEFIELPDDIAAVVEGRSSVARMGIEVHMTASFIDPGYKGTLTFEIFNAGSGSVNLFPGARVAQLRFFRVNKPTKSYRQKKKPKYSGFFEQNKSRFYEDDEFKRLNYLQKD